MIPISSPPKHRGFWAQVAFIASQVGLAFWQAAEFAAQMPINHVLWAAIVAAEIALLVLMVHHKWKLAARLTIERFIIFSPVLNIIRGKPFFYTNASGSLMDKYLTPTTFKILWIAAVVVEVGWNILDWVKRRKLDHKAKFKLAHWTKPKP